MPYMKHEPREFTAEQMATFKAARAQALATTKQSEADYSMNELHEAFRAYQFEQIGSASYLIAFEANKGRKPNGEDLKHHTAALNEALRDLYALVLLYGGKAPRKTPQVSFSAERKCDARCTQAKGNECECSCGGINHGIERSSFLNRKYALVPGEYPMVAPVGYDATEGEEHVSEAGAYERR